MMTENSVVVQYLKGLAGEPISVEYISNCRLKFFVEDYEITYLINFLLGRKAPIESKGVYADGSVDNKASHILENVNSIIARIDKAPNAQNYIFNSDCFNDITTRTAPRF